MHAVYKEAGKPLPTFSEDDYVDFVVTEAVILKAMEHKTALIEKQKEEDRRKAFLAGKPGDPLPPEAG